MVGKSGSSLGQILMYLSKKTPPLKSVLIIYMYIYMCVKCRLSNSFWKNTEENMQ